MTSHLHLLCRAREGFQLSNIVRDLKKYLSKTLTEKIQEEAESRREWLLDRMEWRGEQDLRITQYKFWKPDNHAIFIPPERIDMLHQKLDYIHLNPVKAGFVEEAEHYVYSSAKDYAGGKGKVQLVLLS